MTQVKIIHLMAVAATVLTGYRGDYHAAGDYTSYAANYYPEYNFNYSAPKIPNSQKRIFTDEINLGI